MIAYGPNQADFQDGFFSGRVGLRQANKETTAPGENDLVRATFSLGMAPVYRARAAGSIAWAPWASASPGGAQRRPAWRLVRFMAGPAPPASSSSARARSPSDPASRSCRSSAPQCCPGRTGRLAEVPATARALTQPTVYNDVASLWLGAWNDVLAQKGTMKAILDDLVRQVNAMLAQEP